MHVLVVQTLIYGSELDAPAAIVAACVPGPGVLGFSKVYSQHMLVCMCSYSNSRANPPEAAFESGPESDR